MANHSQKTQTFNNKCDKSENIILGIDPGTKVTGFGVIEKRNNSILPIDYGCIRPPYKYHLNKRYFIIYSAIEELILKYKPSSISIETQFVKKNIQSAIKLGMARGCVIIAAEKYNIPIYEYAPKKAKLSITGNGSASKHQVKWMVEKILNIKKENLTEDAADALALAFCHINQQKQLY